MPWHCTALEDFDDDHATAAAWTSRLAGIDGGRGGPTFRFCNGKQLTGACDVAGASAFGEQRRKLKDQVQVRRNTAGLPASRVPIVAIRRSPAMFEGRYSTIRRLADQLTR
jgi:hypothetical protein